MQSRFLLSVWLFQNVLRRFEKLLKMDYIPMQYIWDLTVHNNICDVKGTSFVYIVFLHDDMHKKGQSSESLDHILYCGLDKVQPSEPAFIKRMKVWTVKSNFQLGLTAFFSRFVSRLLVLSVQRTQRKPSGNEKMFLSKSFISRKTSANLQTHQRQGSYNIQQHPNKRCCSGALSNP